MLKGFVFVPRFHEHDHGMIWPLLFQGWTINYAMFFYGVFALPMLLWRRRFLAEASKLAWLEQLGDASHGIYLFHMSIFGARPGP
ncbi:hypothetical protein ACVNIS_21225 [Sphaerotilaceae bacterium SBD11-9]